MGLVTEDGNRGGDSTDVELAALPTVNVEMLWSTSLSLFQY